MTQTVTGSGVDDGRTAPNSAPDSRPAILRFVERYKRASGTTNPTLTTPAVAPGPPPGIGDVLGPGELERLHDAVRRATELYPGPIGDLIARDLEAVAEFGFRFARGTLYRRLVDDLLGPAGDVAIPDGRARLAVVPAPADRPGRIATDRTR